MRTPPLKTLPDTRAAASLQNSHPGLNCAARGYLRRRRRHALRQESPYHTAATATCLTAFPWQHGLAGAAPAAAMALAISS